MSGNEPTNNEHLEEVSTEERIKLVQGDNWRRGGQIVIALILIGFTIGYSGYYLIYEAEEEFKADFAIGLQALLYAGIGAAFAIFGLGRTVARRTNGT